MQLPTMDPEVFHVAAQWLRDVGLPWLLLAVEVVAAAALGLLVLLIVVVLLCGGPGNFLRIVILRVAPRFLDAPIAIESISVRPHRLVIKGLEIGSPSGFKAAHTINWRTLTILIDHYRPLPMPVSVILDGYSVIYETNDGRTNFESLAKGPKAPPDTKTEEKQQLVQKPAKPKVVLKQLTLEDGTAYVQSAHTTVPLPTISLHDVGTENGGLTYAEVASIVTSVLMRTIVGGMAKAGFNVAASLITSVARIDKLIPAGTLSALGGAFTGAGKMAACLVTGMYDAGSHLIPGRSAIAATPVEV